MPQTRRRGHRRHPLIRHAHLPIALVFSLILSSIIAAGSRAEDSAHRSVTTVSIVLKPGDSFHHAVLQGGVSPGDAFAAERTVGNLYDLHNLRPGQAITLSLGPEAGADGKRTLLAVHIETGRGTDLTIVRTEDGSFESGKTAEAGTLAVHQQTIVVTANLQDSLAAAHVPAGVAAEVGKAAIFDPDFPQTPKSGAKLTIVYETFGRSARDSAVLRYASLDDGSKRHQVYRYALADSLVAFLTENGLGTAALSLADPVGDARVTSGFGWRVHPILGVWKFHNGIDYAAPRGTPVHVAADGRPVDPQKDDLAVPVTLSNKDLEKFRQFVQTAAVPK